jgi:RNA polymerase sigma-70 factor (ECF subfamily)
MIDEKSLIHNLKSGHEESLDLLYAAYGQKIYNLAYRMTGNQEDAEDISQETLIRVCRHIDQFRGDSKLYTWIYAITKNLCHGFLKQKKKNTHASMEALIYSAQSEETTGTFSHEERQVLLNQIKAGCFTGLLRCLSFYQRLAFILHVLLNLPMKDVAEILDKSEGAAKVLLHRARRNLKEFMCRNCSLYDPNNPCRCENLIGFSLARGWIKKPAGNQWEEAYAVAPHTIEAEIEGIRKITELYKTLVNQVPSESLIQRIQGVIQQEDWAIFSSKKV